jgi:hypothetical protein
MSEQNKWTESMNKIRKNENDEKKNNERKMNYD